MDIDSLKASKKTDQLFLVCVDHYDTSHATFYYYKKEDFVYSFIPIRWKGRPTNHSIETFF